MQVLAWVDSPISGYMVHEVSVDDFDRFLVAHILHLNLLLELN